MPIFEAIGDLDSGIAAGKTSLDSGLSREWQNSHVRILYLRTSTFAPSTILAEPCRRRGGSRTALPCRDLG